MQIFAGIPAATRPLQAWSYARVNEKSALNPNPPPQSVRSETTALQIPNHDSHTCGGNDLQQQTDKMPSRIGARSSTLPAADDRRNPSTRHPFKYPAHMPQALYLYTSRGTSARSAQVCNSASVTFHSKGTVAHRKLSTAAAWPQTSLRQQRCGLKRHRCDTALIYASFERLGTVMPCRYGTRGSP